MQIKIKKLYISFACMAITGLPVSVFALEPAPSGIKDIEQTLPTIVVQATKLDTSVQKTAASVYIVDSSVIQNNQPQINLSESLNRVPGIQVQNRQNYAQDLQISMRGFGARSTFGVRGIRLYVDDIPATMPDGQGQTSNIDLNSVDRIEVLNGSSSALYGNASGGVILAYSEEGSNPPTITTQFSAGSHDTYHYGIKAQAGQSSSEKNYAAPAYVVSANRFTTNGYRDHSQASKNLFNSKLSWHFADDSRLKLILNHVDIEADDPLGLTRAQWDSNAKGVDPNAIHFNTRKTVKQTQAGMLFDQPLTDQQSIRVMSYVGQRDTTQYQSIPVFVQISKPGWQGHAGGVIDLQRTYYGGDIRWTTKDFIAGQQSTLIAGLAYDAMQEKRQGFENFMSGNTGQLLGLKGKLRRNEDNELYNVDPYLQASWNFLPTWRLDAGLRYATVHFDSSDHYIAPQNPDDSGAKTFKKLLPSLSFSWSVLSHLNLYGSYAKGFETPTFNEISYRPDGKNGLNLDLQAASNDTTEIGLKSKLGQGLLTTALFHTNTDHEIVVANNTNGRSTYQNAGKTERQGLELAWNGQLWRDLKGTLSYTRLMAKYRSSAGALSRGNHIPGVAKQSGYIAIDWQPEQGWQAGFDMRYLGKVYVNDQNSEASPDYSVSSLYTGYVWNIDQWAIKSFVRLDNVFNQRYAGSVIVNESNGRYFEPAMKRNISTGLSLSFNY